MTTFTSEDRLTAEKDGSVTVSIEPTTSKVTISVEPIPFAGMVTLLDQEDTEQMLREQNRLLQKEIMTLKSKLLLAGIA